MRYVQKNGRERGRLEGIGNGAHQEVSPLARPGVTPSKRERRDRDDRRRKSRGWDD
jgi:hypothetical protein